MVKAGLDVEYDLADPDILETVRDFLIGADLSTQEDEDTIDFGAKLIASTAGTQGGAQRRNVVKKVD